jgi:hypothetical protein
MNRLELLKNELWCLFDRMDKDATGKGIKTGLVAAQAIVAKHTDGYVLVPVETELNAFIEQTQRLLERSKACAVNPKNASKTDYYNGQSHGIEMVLDALKDVIACESSNHDWISVDERLPEKFDEVLVVSKWEDKPSSGHWTGRNWEADRTHVNVGGSIGFMTEDYTINGVTHWQALPAAPKGDNHG